MSMLHLVCVGVTLGVVQCQNFGKRCAIIISPNHQSNLRFETNIKHQCLLKLIVQGNGVYIEIRRAIQSRLFTALAETVSSLTVGLHKKLLYFSLSPLSQEKTNRKNMADVTYGLTSNFAGFVLVSLARQQPAELMLLLRFVNFTHST